jgi:hypothetical protein
MPDTEAVEAMSPSQPATSKQPAQVTKMPAASDQPALRSAAWKVANIVELVETIILALPPLDAFLAANVCVKWRQIFEESPPINTYLREEVTAVRNRDWRPFSFTEDNYWETIVVMPGHLYRSDPPSPNDLIVGVRPHQDQKPVFAIYCKVPLKDKRHVRFVDGKTARMSLRIVDDEYGNSMFKAHVKDSGTGLDRVFTQSRNGNLALGKWMFSQGVTRLVI